MPLVTSNAGELKMLESILNNPTPENLILKLYRTDVTPTATSNAASFTEANFTSYAPATLTAGSWSAASTVSGKAESTYATQSWTCGTTGNTIYGYWLQGATSNTVYWAEKFGTARALSSGDVLNLSPKLTLDSEN